jgi:hypothetical protein
MIPKTSPGASGAIRARLDYLRNRKAILDELIACLERYAETVVPIGGRVPHLRAIHERKAAARARRPLDRLAGAA